MVLQLAKSNYSFAWFLQSFIWGSGLVLPAGDLENVACLGISAAFSGTSRIYGRFDEVKAGARFLPGGAFEQTGLYNCEELHQTRAELDLKIIWGRWNVMREERKIHIK